MFMSVLLEKKKKKRLLIKLHLFGLRQQTHAGGSTGWKWEDFISY